MNIVAFPPQTQVEYPTSDGKPMAETMKHILVITYLLDALMAWFRDRSDMYVGANNLIYYLEGFPKKFFAPDVYLIPGLDKTPRRVLKLWETKRAPAVIFEITSRETWKDDIGAKMDLYAELGVREYFVYDVEHEELEPPLVGYRLVEDAYVLMPPDENGKLYSAEMQLELQEVDGALRLINPRTGEMLQTYAESQAARAEAEELVRDAEELARIAQERTRAVEAENARLRAEIETLRGKQA